MQAKYALRRIGITTSNRGDSKCSTSPSLFSFLCCNRRGYSLHRCRWVNVIARSTTSDSRTTTLEFLANDGRSGRSVLEFWGVPKSSGLDKVYERSSKPKNAKKVTSRATKVPRLYPPRSMNDCFLETKLAHSCLPCPLSHCYLLRIRPVQGNVCNYYDEDGPQRRTAPWRAPSTFRRFDSIPRATRCAPRCRRDCSVFLGWSGFGIF